jgi:ATP-dependent DNA helicase 2 subunit 2
LLAPSVDADAECLFEVELPFAEDLRSYRFPALDKIVTVSGKELKQHRFLPNDDLMDAMSAYVDAMDLSTFDEDDEGYAIFCSL